MRSACWKRLTDMTSERTLIKRLFGCYCVMMLWLLLLRRIAMGAGNVQVNLQPLDTVKRYLWVLQHSANPIQRRYALANILGNVGLFLPLGVFLPMLFQKMQRFWLFLVCVIQGIALVELCQLFTGLGACDIDDGLLNVSGAVMGWFGWKITTKIRLKNQQ